MWAAAASVRSAHSADADYRTLTSLRLGIPARELFAELHHVFWHDRDQWDRKNRRRQRTNVATWV